MRRMLKEIRLERIAAVDRPCQQGAVVSILKRAPDEEIEKSADDERILNLQKRVLLAKSGMALLSALIVKEWDESKHPRADNGEFGTGGSSSGAKSGTEDTKD